MVIDAYYSGFCGPTGEAGPTKPRPNQTQVAAFERTISAMNSLHSASCRGQGIGVYSGFSISLPGGELYENTAGASGKGRNRMECTYRRYSQKEKWPGVSCRRLLSGFSPWPAGRCRRELGERGRDGWEIWLATSRLNIPGVYLARHCASQAVGDFSEPGGVARLPDRDGINRGNLPKGAVLIPGSDGLMAQTLGTRNNYIYSCSLIEQI